ncbi:hypothetical protein T492DRAFT_869549 [Pavlovales sp. CCMP2436]|nr:hypothetical protein T492DRAFT_869549 [Pavlovales sp. CCMP2436]
MPWDEDVPTALARVRRLYGCDANECNASGSEAAVELRAHLLALAAEAARGVRSGCDARSGRGSEVALSCDEVTHEVVPALFAFLYVGHVDDAGELLTAELVDGVNCWTDNILLIGIYVISIRAIELIIEAVDDANALSLFLAAIGLRSAELQRNLPD